MSRKVHDTLTGCVTKTKGSTFHPAAARRGFYGPATLLVFPEFHFVYLRRGGNHLTS